MSTCQTCTYWSDRAPFDRPQNHVLRHCKNEKLTDCLYKNAEDELVYGYQEDGGFYTGPKFGCVHHKER